MPAQETAFTLATAEPHSSSGADKRGRGHSSTGQFLRLNIYALILTAFWTPLNTLLLPGLVESRAPAEIRGSALGAMTLVGVGIAVLVQPGLGAMSDRWRSPERRRVPIAAASVVSVPLVIGLWLVPGFFTLLAIYIVLQCAMNTAQAAFQALIPDYVGPSNRSRASGIKTSLEVGGNAVGLGLAGGVLLAGGGEGVQILTLAGLLAAGVTIAIRTVPRIRHEPANLEPLRPPWKVFAPLKTGSAEFRLAILLRFLFLLGLYPVQRFILFLLEDRYGLEDPLARASIFIFIAIVIASAGGLAAGILDDYISTRWLLAGTVILSGASLAGIAFSPTLPILAIPSFILAFNAGAFQALNWGAIANALRDDEAARYFGLANIATAGAGAMTGIFGPLVDLADRFVPGATYQILFSICALVTASCLLVLRHDAAAPSIAEND